MNLYYRNVSRVVSRVPRAFFPFELAGTIMFHHTVRKSDDLMFTVCHLYCKKLVQNSSAGFSRFLTIRLY